jgi:hypothetical protein
MEGDQVARRVHFMQRSSKLRIVLPSLLGHSSSFFFVVARHSTLLQFREGIHHLQRLFVRICGTAAMSGTLKVSPQDSPGVPNPSRRRLRKDSFSSFFHHSNPQD